MIVACPDRRAGNDLKALDLAFHHQGPTFIRAHFKLLQTWLIETEGNMGLIIYLDKRCLHSPSALSI